MKSEIVAVGTELLLGQIANTNAQWMSQRLADVGVDVVYQTVVGDNQPRIEEILRRAIERADVVLVTGGLGPTGDDLTRDAIAGVLAAPMERQPELEAMLRERFSGMGRAMPENNLRQADVPRGARYIRPVIGTAPGLAVEIGRVRLYAMAGVPAEMREIMEGTVLPELAALAGPAVVRSRVLRCTGVGESAVARVLEDLFEAGRNPTIAYLAGAGEVKIRLTAKAPSAEEADALIAPLVEVIADRLGDIGLQHHRRTAGGSGGPAAARAVEDGRRGGIAHRRADRGTADVGARGVRLLPRIGGRVLGSGQAGGARCGRVDDRGARGRERGLRPRDGGRSAPRSSRRMWRSP